MLRVGIALVACGVMAMLSGCAEHPASPVVKPQHAGYLMAGRQCGGVGKLSPMTLKLDQKRLVYFGENSHCVVTKAKIKEPAVLLSLPADKDVYYVRVRVQRHGHRVLIPRIELLNSERKPLRTFAYKEMKRSGGALTLTFFVEPNKGDPAYLLLYPDTDLVGRERQELNQGIGLSYYGLFNLFYGTEQKLRIVFSETGNLEVRTFAYRNPDLNPSES